MQRDGTETAFYTTRTTTMDDSTKQRAMIGVVAGNFSVMAVMIGMAFTQWTIYPKIGLSILIGGTVGAIAFFLAKAE